MESLTLRDFTAEEVAELYQQHTGDTGQRFEPEALAAVFAITQGQPWLVNALGRQLIEKVVPDAARAITAADVDVAKEILIRRQDTHLDSRAERLREPRVRRIIEPMLAGRTMPEVPEDELRFLLDLGLVRLSPEGGLIIANPIYREVIPRALSSGRMDLLLRLGADRLAIEIKVWREIGDPDPKGEGLAQLDGYLDGLGLETGWLVVFDRRPDQGPISKRTGSEEAVTPGGRKVTVICG